MALTTTSPRGGRHDGSSIVLAVMSTRTTPDAPPSAALIAQAARIAQAAP